MGNNLLRRVRSYILPAIALATTSFSQYSYADPKEFAQKRTGLEEMIEAETADLPEFLIKPEMEWKIKAYSEIVQKTDKLVKDEEGKRKRKFSTTEKFEVLTTVLQKEGYQIDYMVDQNDPENPTKRVLTDDLNPPVKISYALQFKKITPLFYIGYGRREGIDMQIVTIGTNLVQDNNLKLQFPTGRTIIKYQEDGRTKFYNPLATNSNTRKLDENKIRTMQTNPHNVLSLDPEYSKEQTVDDFVREYILKRSPTEVKISI